MVMTRPGSLDTRVRSGSACVGVCVLVCSVHGYFVCMLVDNNAT